MRKTKTKSAATGISMPASEMVDLAAIQFAKYNPRIMPPEQMAALKGSLVKHGLVLNLVVQREGMVLIGGHQRVTAVRELCAERGWEVPARVPAIVLDVGDAEARQLNVALNRIDGEFDAFRLGELFQSIRQQMTLDDVIATGFTVPEIDQAVQLVMPIDEAASILEAQAAEEALSGFARSITLSVEFDTVEQRDEAKEALRALAGKGKPGAALLRAVKAATTSRRRAKAA